MSVYKNYDEIYTSLKGNFEEKIKDSIQTGSVIDIFNKVISEEIEQIYEHVEENKNPYLFTNTYGEDLDSLGYWVNLTRQDNESDESYKYRLKDWTLSNEASNTTAIENALLNPVFSSNIQYVPYTHGSGTGTCYVIPKEYEAENIHHSLEEAERLLSEIISPSLYVEYIVPAIRGIIFHCFLSVNGDETTIKNNISTKIQNYVNSIAPGDYLSIKDIILLGLNESGVEYFNIVSYSIDGETSTDIKVIQELETKFLFDSITWSGEV
jgi:hypothetical protein